MIAFSFGIYVFTSPPKKNANRKACRIEGSCKHSSTCLEFLLGVFSVGWVRVELFRLFSSYGSLKLPKPGFQTAVLPLNYWKVKGLWDLGLPQMLSNQMTCRQLAHSQVWFQSIAVKMEAFFGKFVVREQGCSFTKHAFKWTISTIMPRHTDAFLQHM